jgi:hypothetical protein
VPPLIRRYIKTSFAFLIAGLVLGGWILVAEFVLGVYPLASPSPPTSTSSSSASC